MKIGKIDGGGRWHFGTKHISSELSKMYAHGQGLQTGYMLHQAGPGGPQFVMPLNAAYGNPYLVGQQMKMIDNLVKMDEVPVVPKPVVPKPVYGFGGTAGKRGLHIDSSEAAPEIKSAIAAIQASKKKDEERYAQRLEEERRAAEEREFHQKRLAALPWWKRILGLGDGTGAGPRLV